MEQNIVRVPNNFGALENIRNIVVGMHTNHTGMAAEISMNIKAFRISFCNGASVIMLVQTYCTRLVEDHWLKSSLDFLLLKFMLPNSAKILESSSEILPQQDSILTSIL